MNKRQKSVYLELFSIKWSITYNIMGATWAWVILYAIFRDILVSSFGSALILTAIVVFDFREGLKELKKLKEAGE